MITPAWLLDFGAALMLAVAAFCAGRLVAGPLTGLAVDYDVDVAHVAMAVSMAGMLVLGLRTLPAGAWEVIFVALTGWFAARIVLLTLRRGPWSWDRATAHHVSHYWTHLVMAAAMLYMVLVIRPAPRPSRLAVTTGMAMGGTPGSVVPLLFVVVLVISAVWHLDGLGRFRAGLPYVDTDVPAPALAPAPTPAPVPASLTVPVPTSVPGGLPVAVGASATASPAVGHEVAAVGAAVARPAPGRRRLAPRVEISCHVVMCVAMSWMLVLMR